MNDEEDLLSLEEFLERLSLGFEGYGKKRWESYCAEYLATEKEDEEDSIFDWLASENGKILKRRRREAANGLASDKEIEMGKLFAEHVEFLKGNK